MKRILTVLLALSLAIFGASCGESTTNDDTTTTTSKTELKFETPTSLTDDAVGFQFEKPEIGEAIAVLTIKDYGEIKIRLFADSAPKTVTNFKTHIKDGYYNGLTFHRIIENFMIQGGCPKGDGTGDSGQNIKGEFANNGVDNDISHVRGVISMARGGYDNNSGSCQFFIVHQDSPHLDGDYAAFGKVTKGMDVVDKIATETEVYGGNGEVMSYHQPVIKTIKIID